MMQTSIAATIRSTAPIGVFDSGIGGLSIVKALRHTLPNERFVYYADSANAPYGEKGDSFVRQRCLAIADQLQHQYGVKALVVACNTATAAAIGDLRAVYADIPIIGVEPALKPAVLHSPSGNIVVMATRGTLASVKFQALLRSVRMQSAHLNSSIVCQPCDGLADAIERHCLELNHIDIHSLVKHHLAAAGFNQASYAHQTQVMADTLVLGCTHYPLIMSVWQQYLPANVCVMDNGVAVAKQLLLRLQAHNLLNRVGIPVDTANQARMPLRYLSSSDTPKIALLQSLGLLTET
jgi:glutamate racemase